MVTPTSPLTDVFAANPATPTESDLNNWTKITPLAAAETISTKVGLFGADLTDFYANCAIASSVCTATDYHDFTGWAIGAKWTWDDEATTGEITGICFELDSNCVSIEAGADDNVINSFASSDAPAAAFPVADSIPDDAYCTMSEFGGFSDTCWYGTLEALTVKA